MGIGEENVAEVVDDNTGEGLTEQIDNTEEIDPTIRPDFSNNRPVAEPDFATTNIATPVTIDVLANDSDPDNDAIEIVDLVAAQNADIDDDEAEIIDIFASQNGGVVVNPDNTLTYTPNDGFVGEDIVFYAIQDSNGSVDNNIVTVTVGNVADAINGTGDNDILLGTSDNDIINGLGGDDSLRGFNGNDSLVGNDGDDTLIGNRDNDTLLGVNGSDFLNAGNGADLLSGGNGNDTLVGGNGNDSLFGGAGTNIFNGGNNDDLLEGGDERDILRGGSGDDLIFGNLGNDFLRGQSGNDTLFDGAGNDVAFGDEGADVFVLEPNSGRIVMRDYVDNTDQIGLADGLTFDDLTIANNGSGNRVIIRDLTNDNALLGVIFDDNNVLDAADLTADDFIDA